MGGKNAATLDQKRDAEILARGHTDLAINALVAVARDPEQPAARVSASRTLLDRGYGRPREALNVDMRAHVTSAPPSPPMTNWNRLTADELNMLAHLLELSSRQEVFLHHHADDDGDLGRITADYTKRRSKRTTDRVLPPAAGPELPLVVDVLVRCLEAEVAWITGEGDDFGMTDWREKLRTRLEALWQ